MGTARHVGRVGGLAVALGIGAAIVNNQPVVWATPDSGASANQESASNTDPTPNEGASTDTKTTEPEGGVDVDAEDPETTIADDDFAEPTPHKKSRLSLNTSTTETDRSMNIIRAQDDSDNEDERRSIVPVTEEPKPEPKVETAQSPDTRTVTTENTPLPVTPPPVTGPIVGMINVAAQLVSGFLSPFANQSPTAPSTTPVEWVTLAAVRREVGVDSVAAAAASGPIVYVPNAQVITDPTDPLSGVISNSVEGTSTSGLPLAFTVISGPSGGGKVNLDETTGTFVFLPDASTFTSPSRTETFSILVHEVTPLVAALSGLAEIPLVGTFVDDALTTLYRIPILNSLLAPIIGSSIVTPVSINVDEVNPTGNPIAFTTMVTSFDGTRISTNWFPALGLQTGQQAPTIFNGPGLGSPGNTDPTTTIDPASGIPGLAPFRAAGYNMVTWDPRGEFASGGVLQLDSPNFEGRDVQALIGWAAGLAETELDGPGDPRMGMVGGSYGGGIQLVTAAIDNRVDAIVPTIAWHALTESLYPKQIFKTAWGTLLLLALVETGARINPQIYTAALLGDTLGVIPRSAVALLERSGPGDLVSQITAPTLLIQGTADGLFPLAQSVANAQLLTASGVPVKMVWFCGGHGVCLDPGVDRAEQAGALLAAQLAWLQQYVQQDGTPADDLPTFRWVDQLGGVYTSDVMPFDASFRGTPVTASGDGGLLPIVPLLGGSGPQTLPEGAPPLLDLAVASKADNAINVSVPVEEGTQILGQPVVTFTYSGLGTSRAVYAQIVDEDTGLVLGNLITPIPVTLDGRSHTVAVTLGQLENVVYTAPPGGGNLTLQLVSTATPYENVFTFGAINVSDVEVTLPTVADGVATPAVMPFAAAATVPMTPQPSRLWW